MALTAPTQQRAADPFSEYRYSSVINRFTRLITAGNNCIIQGADSFVLTIIDWKTVTVGPGIFIKDDALVHITDNYNVDFDNQVFYLDPSDTMSDVGYYYIVAQYSYARTLPAPKAYYRIIREDTVFNTLSSEFVYIGNIYVRWDAGDVRHEVDNALPPYYVHPLDSNIKRVFPTTTALVVDGGEL